MSTRLAAVGGASLLVSASALWAVCDSSSKVRDFDASVAVKTEEHARYPCQQLPGYDVVVKNYYVPARETAVSGSLAEGSLSARWRYWWQQVFADGPTQRLLAPPSAFSSSAVREPGHMDTIRPSSTTTTTTATTSLGSSGGSAPNGRRTSASADISGVRLLVRDEADAGESTSPPSLCSGSTWPRGTVKYSALVLEPSAPRAYGSGDLEKNPPLLLSSPSSSSRGFLQQWTDAATDQTVIRCDPLSRDVDLNCSNRGSSLEAPYLRAMMSVLAWLPARPAPLHVGVLGVGGGALPAFLQHYCGRVVERMDLVDVEPMCLHAALQDLGMESALEVVAPPSSHVSSSAHSPRTDGVHLFAMDAMEFLRQWALPRLGAAAAGLAVVPPLPPLPSATTMHSSSGHCSAPVFMSAVSNDPRADGGTSTVVPLPPSPPTTARKWQTSVDTMGQSTAQSPFDLLLVDLYAGSALSHEVTQDTFLKLCRANLSSHGVVAFNLPQRVKSFEKQCELAFGGPSQVYAFPVPSAANYIVVACKGKRSALSHRLLCRRAQEATHTFHLPFSLQKQFPISWKYW